MFLEFRLRNFRSYAAEKRFTLVAGPGKELPENTMGAEGFERAPLLRSAAIYGANASGKSNLVHAFGFFRSFVLRSTEAREEGEKIAVLPFLLDPKLAGEPSEFEITFLFGGVRHQYGFVVSQERVHEEWLIAYPRGKPQEWFHRTWDKAGNPEWAFSRTHLRGDKRQLAEKTLPEALFLSVAAGWNHPQIKPIYEWFRRKLRVLPRRMDINSYSRIQDLKNASFLEWLSDVLRAADLGISRVIAQEAKIGRDDLRFPPALDPDVRKYLTDRFLGTPTVDVRTRRKVSGLVGGVEWDLEMESDGTQRMFELLGPIYDVLGAGAILIMDELDTSLHAHITREIVQLFNNPATNPNGAQLVFTTHDTSLLDPTLLRRDQVWFTAKDEAGATDLYSLQDFSVRKGEPLLKGYLAGRYGATPVVERFPFPPASKESGKPEPVRRRR